MTRCKFCTFINLQILTKVSFQEESLSKRSPLMARDAVVRVDMDAKLLIAPRKLFNATFSCLNLLQQCLEAAIPSIKYINE